MGRRPHIRNPTAETLEQIMERHEYSSFDEAITHALREADYDV